MSRNRPGSLKHVIFGILLFCLPCSAELIEVKVTAVFTATGNNTGQQHVGPSNCEGCTQTFYITFQYDRDLLVYENYASPSALPVSLVPGTFSYVSDGFLGTMFSSGAVLKDRGLFYVDFRVPGDNIDLWFYPGRSDPSLFEFSHVLGLVFWRCSSTTCMDAYGFGSPDIGYYPSLTGSNVDASGATWFLPTSQTITETRVPEPSLGLLLLSTGVMAGAVSRRLRRRLLSYRAERARPHSLIPRMH